MVIALSNEHSLGRPVMAGLYRVLHPENIYDPDRQLPSLLRISEIQLLTASYPRPRQRYDLHAIAMHRARMQH